MKFKIVSVSPSNGHEDWVVYDNIANKLYSKRGIPLCLPFDPRFETYYKDAIKEGERDRQYPKSRCLKSLRFRLGAQSDFDCKSCGQRSNTKVIAITPESRSKEDEFVMRLSSSVDSVETIDFIGGEDFNYQRRFFPLVEALKKRYPSARFILTTNGSVLAESFSNRLLDNRIDLVISHDGLSVTHCQNGKDILDNPDVLSGIRCYLVRNTEENLNLRFRISVVVTPENCRLSELPSFFKQKLGREVKILFESVVKAERNTSHFTSESANLLINEMLQAGVDRSPNNPLSFIGKLADSVVRRLVKEEDLRRLLYSCNSAQTDTLSVDVEKACATPLIPWTARKECPFCPFLVSCLGGCSIQNDEDHEISCRTLRLWNMGVFYVAWFRMFNTVIQRIEPIGEV